MEEGVGDSADGFRSVMGGEGGLQTWEEDGDAQEGRVGASPGMILPCLGCQARWRLSAQDTSSRPAQSGDSPL